MQPTAPAESVDAVAVSPSDAPSQYGAFAHSQPLLESLENPSQDGPSVALSSPSLSRNQPPSLLKYSGAQFEAMPISTMDKLVEIYLLGRATPLSNKPPLPHDIVHVVIMQCPELSMQQLQLHASSNDLKPLIESYPELIGISSDCWERKSFQALRELELFWPKAVKEAGGNPFQRRMPNPPSHPEVTQQAVEYAWTAPYTSDYHEILLRSIKEMKESGEQNDYLNTVAILQSSGSGKSRMVDQMASLIFTIPLNLREDRDNHGLAWPPPDKAVRGILKHAAFDYAAQRLIYFEFFTELFALVKIELDELCRKGETEDLIIAWKKHLSQPSVRSQFYEKLSKNIKLKRPTVVPHEKALLTENKDTRSPESAASAAAVNALRELLLTLTGSTFWRTSDAPTKKTSKEVKLVIYFDESHVLTEGPTLKDEQKDKEYDKTLYDTLLSVFNSFVAYPIFAIFLSTTSRISYFAPPKSDVKSSRAYNSNCLQAPVSETPFDIAPGLEIVPGTLSIQDVSKVSFMTQFGRPLWWAMLRAMNPETPSQVDDYERMLLLLARSKLSGQPNPSVQATPSDTAALAVADVRLCFDYEPTRSKNENIVTDLVASHMRTVFSMPSHREYFRSGYPSEPILAEAAAEQLDYWRSNVKETFLIDTLEHHMKNGLLNAGEQGEVVARALLTEAYDRAAKRENPDVNGQFSRGCSLISFIEELFEPGVAQAILDSYPDNIPRDTKDPNRQKFRTVFQKAKVRFTHFVKVDDVNGITTGTLFPAFVRGMAFIAKTGQAIIDLGIPVLFVDDKLGETAMTAILIQVKRRIKAGTVVALDIRAENIGLFVTEASRRPYCTLVMELGVQPGLDKTIGDDGKGEDMGKGQARGKGRGKGQTRPSTPPKIVAQNAYSAKTPSKVQVKDYGISRSTTRAASQNATNNHPRYNIFAYGCSSTVYKGISHSDKHRYALLLATRDMFHEHARQRKEALLKVWQLKPAWSVHHNCYHWVNGMNVGTATADTEEDEVDMVVVSEYDGGEGQDELTLPA